MAEFSYNGVGSDQGPIVAYTKDNKTWILLLMDVATGAQKNIRHFDSEVTFVKGSQFGAIIKVKDVCYSYSFNELKKCSCKTGQYIYN